MTDTTEIEAAFEAYRAARSAFVRAVYGLLDAKLGKLTPYEIDEYGCAIDDNYHDIDAALARHALVNTIIPDALLVGDELALQACGGDAAVKSSNYTAEQTNAALKAFIQHHIETSDAGGEFAITRPHRRTAAQREMALRAQQKLEITVRQVLG